MNNLILAQNQKPFETAKEARFEQKKLKLENKTKVIEYQKGWALEKGNEDNVPVSNAKSIKEISEKQKTKSKRGRPPRSNKPINRPKRQPLATRNILTAPHRPGFVRRFVNDVEDRIEIFKDAGYKIVTEPTKVGDKRAGTETPLGTPVRKSVGGGTVAVLMEIPEEFYNEDQMAKEAKRKEMEQSMRQQTQKEGHYGEIKINR